MGARDAIAKLLMGARGGAKKGANIATSAAKAGKYRYDIGRNITKEGIPRSVLEGVKEAGIAAKDRFGALGPSGKKQVAGAAGLGAGGALAAMGLMSGGDDEAMMELAERSGLPVGGMGLGGLRQEQLGGFRSALEKALMSSDDPTDVLMEIEEKVYNPIAMRSNELPEDYPSDDLYGFGEKLASVLYADAPDDKKLAALYDLSKME